MKIKDIEGSADEIGQLCREQNLCINAYLGVKKETPSWAVLLSFTIYAMVCIIHYYMMPLASEEWVTFIFFAAILSFGVLVFIVTKKYEKTGLTLVVAFIGALLLSVSMHILTPVEATKVIQKKADSLAPE
ncbi:hypothetical protein N9R81_06400 [Flavobacteriales bacterium]|nr:hypothetical protein [Flavobacteriales bacterium]